MSEELPLRGVFLRLVSRGFPLTIRDYRDALQALRMGYGHGSREALLSLCQTLWARTSEEQRQIELLFRTFPLPTDDEIRTVAPEAVPTHEPGYEPIRPPPRRADLRGREKHGETPSLSFDAPETGGLGVPRAAVPKEQTEPFVFAPVALVPLRSMIIAWRRYRMSSRTGPRTELDVDATIQEQTRRGFILAPALVPSRVNRAGLVVLLDVSASMAAWISSVELFEESLGHGRLGDAGLYFFDNWPDDDLYQLDTRRQPAGIDELLSRHPRASLLVVSDGGAARGRMNSRRLEGTRRFLERAGQSWSPVAWVNPMPERRWAGTTAERIAALPEVAMMEWNESGLIAAVDMLRGLKG